MSQLTKDTADNIYECVRHGGANKDDVECLLLLYELQMKEGYGVAEGERYDVTGTSGSPCILCGEWWADMRRWPTRGDLLVTPHGGVSVCGSPECMEEAARLRKLFPKGIETPAVHKYANERGFIGT